MKHGSTHFLRFALCAVVAFVLFLCAYPLVFAFQGGESSIPLVRWSVSLIATGMYVTVIPFLCAVWQAFVFLRLLDKGQLFSEAAVRSVGIAKRCAQMIAVLYVGGIPLLYPIAEWEDAPGVILFGMLMACVVVSVALIFAILHKALQSAVSLKNEHELTV